MSFDNIDDIGSDDDFNDSKATKKSRGNSGNKKSQKKNLKKQSEKKKKKKKKKKEEEEEASSAARNNELRKLERKKTEGKKTTQAKRTKSWKNSMNNNNSENVESIRLLELPPDPVADPETPDVKNAFGIEMTMSARRRHENKVKKRQYAARNRMARGHDVKIIHPELEIASELSCWEKVLGLCGQNQFSLEEIGLTPEQVQSIKMLTPFTDDELIILANKFLDLDVEKNGVLSFRELMELPEFKHNPLQTHMFHLIDKTGDDSVDFVEFVGALSLFSEHAAKMDKIRFLFHVYDIDEDGLIGKEDLRAVMNLTFGDTLSPSEMTQILNRTFREANKDMDPYLNFQEFSDILSDTNVHTVVQIKLE